MPRLQVALDLTDLDKALSVASRVAEECERRWLLFEAGTPLIKARGVEAIKRLAQRFSDVPVVADMKISDVGGLEAELAISSGASYVTVLGQAADETIGAAVESAHGLGGKVIAELMPMVGDIVSRAVKLLSIGVDTLCYHVPIDVQKTRSVDWGRVVGMVRVLKALGASEVAVAGGVTPETARVLARAGADILVVGRFVYSSHDPGRAARAVLESFG